MRGAATALVIAVVTAAVLAAPVAARPIAETIHTSHGVSAELYNPCSPEEYLAFAGYVELETVRRQTSSGGLSLRASLRPLDGTWHWSGWNTTDPDFDPTVPRAGDPDNVYTLAGETRVRGTIEQLPGSVLLSGAMTVMGSGPSDGISLGYSVEYVVDAEGMISAEVTELTIQCPDGTLHPVVFAYFP
jgi:hypothetical protein